MLPNENLAALLIPDIRGRCLRLPVSPHSFGIVLPAKALLELAGRQRELACGGLDDVDQISLEFHRRDPVMAGWRDGEVIAEAVNQNRAERLAGVRVPEADRGIAG